MDLTPETSTEYMEKSVRQSLAEWTHKTSYVLRECLDVALEYPDENWNWRILSSTIGLTPEIVREHIDRPWDWKILSTARHVKLLIEFPDKDWDWDEMCRCICNSDMLLPTDLIIKHIDKPWIWDRLNIYDDIDFFKIMDACPSAVIDWNWRYLSTNDHLTADIFRKYIDKPWDFNQLSYSPRVSIDMIKALPGADWEWWGVSSSEAIHLDEILANPDLPWNWNGVSANPGITYEEARMLPDKAWNWDVFLRKKGGVASFIEYHKRNFAAAKIQQHWRKCVSDPSHAVCRRRLMWEWTNSVRGQLGNRQVP